MTAIFHWFAQNYLELLGAATGLIYIWFSIRQKIWLWHWGILTSAFYIFVFFKQRLYADMSLQTYYLLVSFYGWYNWKFGYRKNDSTQNGGIPVATTTLSLGLILFAVTAVIYIVYIYLLTTIPEKIGIPKSDIPYLDAFITASSIIATWMLARKLIEQWIIWVLVDAISVGMYIYKSMYPTVILFVVYTILAFIGYLKWKKSLKTTAT